MNSNFFNLFFFLDEVYELFGVTCEFLIQLIKYIFCYLTMDLGSNPVYTCN